MDCTHFAQYCHARSTDNRANNCADNCTNDRPHGALDRPTA